MLKLGHCGKQIRHAVKTLKWRRLEQISWTDCVKDEVILDRAKEKGNILHTIKRRNANWIGHILHRNCLLKHVIEGKIEGTGKRGGRRQHLLDDRKERRIFLVSNFRRIMNVVFFLLGDSPASKFYMPTFRNTVPSSRAV